MLFSKLSSTKNTKVPNLSAQFDGKSIEKSQLAHIKGGETQAEIIMWDLKEF